MGSVTSVLTLTEDYPALICVCSPKFGVYTSPSFSTNNGNSNIIHNMGSFYAYPSNPAPSFSTRVTVNGASIVDFTETNIIGQSNGLVVDLITGCKRGNIISLNPNSTYGGAFNGRVTIIGIK